MLDEPDLGDLDLTDKLVVGEPTAEGGFADVCQGTLRLAKGSMFQVAVKSLRVVGHGNPKAKERITKRFYREVLLWRRLLHPNIVSLLGYIRPSNGHLAMVSPWYNGGNIILYLKSHPNSNRRALTLDILDGLVYLHEIPVVHGDLKGENVLVDEFGRASLCDFGMSKFIDDTNHIIGFTTTNAGIGGTQRFMCPELLDETPKSTATDMWAAGCLIVQVLTDDIPYQHIKTVPALLAAISKGTPPSTNRHDTIDLAQWECITECWSESPEARPKAAEVRIHFARPETADGLSIIEFDLLRPLIASFLLEDLLKENEQVQRHIVSTLVKFARTSEENKKQIVRAGAVQKIRNLVSNAPLKAQIEMTACVATLALSDDLRPQLLEEGICEVLIPLINSPSVQVQGNSAEALYSLLSEGIQTTQGRAPSPEYDPLQLQKESEAVADLLLYLEDQTTIDFFAGSPLAALTILSLSKNVDLQRSAAVAFAEITDGGTWEISKDTLDPILFLLRNNDTEVQRAATDALANLAFYNENKLLIVEMGALEPLFRLTLSPNIEVQCNSVRCVTNLATRYETKTKIATSNALISLVRLARSNDIHVQRNATAAMLNMSHPDDIRQRLVSAGVIPILVGLLDSPDTTIQRYGAIALRNIAVDAGNRQELASSEPQLVRTLIGLMHSSCIKVQIQATSVLRNLASDAKYQLETVKAGGLSHLLRLLHSTHPSLIRSSLNCLQRVAFHPANKSSIIEAGFLTPLTELLSLKDNKKAQCRAIGTLRSLASTKQNNSEIVKAGTVQKIKDLVLNAPVEVQIDMTACIGFLASSDELKPQLLGVGICEVLISLTKSPNVNVQLNSAATLRNLSSRDGLLDFDYYGPIIDIWAQPDGGLHTCLCLFLNNTDVRFQHIALQTIMQLLECGEQILVRNIKQSPLLGAHLIELIESPAITPFSLSSQYRSLGSGSNEGNDVGADEITALAKRIIELADTGGRSDRT